MSVNLARRSVAIGILFQVLAGAATFAQTPTQRPCRADYAIRARYDADGRRITGEEIVQWKNETADDVPDLWFHLYWNAYANSETTHLHESGGELRGVMLANEWGWQRVTAVRVRDRDLMPSLRYRQPDDARAEDRSVFSVALPEPVHPGETITVSVEWESRIPRVRRRVGYKDDFLLMAHWFPKLGVYEFGNGWNCHQFHANTEFFSDYGTYDVSLDMPRAYEGKIGASGVLVEPMRVEGERVIAHFVAPSPRDQETADATGQLPLVHEFAWTADPDYVVHRGVFRWDEWAREYHDTGDGSARLDEIGLTAKALGRDPEALRLRDVDVTVFLQPEHASQAERHFDATCTAIFFYGLWFGGFPYEHVTVVDPAWGAGAAGGMEYPTLFTAGSRMFTFQEMHSPESVTVHECGHQFWYGLVGNNEFEAAWLDEGFNTYTQNEALARRYGPGHRTTDFSRLPFDGVAMAEEPGGSTIGDVLALKKLALPFGIVLEPLHKNGPLEFWRDAPLLSYARQTNDPRWGSRNGYLADPDSDPVDTAGWKYVDSQSYRQNSYRRTAVVLASLEGLVGRERFLRGMRSYSERWRYRHPYPQDFFDAFNAGAGVDVSWYFDQAFRSTATVDWKIDVSQKKRKAERGWFQDDAGVFVEREAPKGEKRDEDEDKNDDEDEAKEKSSPPALAASDGNVDGSHANGDVDGPGAKKSLGWSLDLVVRRKGSFILPLELELTFKDGKKERLVWTREEQARSTWWKPLADREKLDSELVSAVLDPDRLYLFDTDMSNNQWFKAEDTRTSLRWAERAFTQYAHLLHWFGGLGG